MKCVMTRSGRSDMERPIVPAASVTHDVCTMYTPGISSGTGLFIVALHKIVMHAFGGYPCAQLACLHDLNSVKNIPKWHVICTSALPRAGYPYWSQTPGYRLSIIQWSPGPPHSRRFWLLPPIYYKNNLAIILLHTRYYASTPDPLSRSQQIIVWSAANVIPIFCTKSVELYQN